MSRPLLHLFMLTLLFGRPAWANDTIFATILVDDEEATKDAVWQRRLSQRLTKASQIIHRQAGIRFVVAGYQRWNSDNRLQDLSLSLREFEIKVQPGRSRLAIGFSSQYKFTRGRHNLGGTRGPLHSHILIRENAPSVAEAERLEVLVHELGHYLGAAHSSRNDSVMRPVVGDGQARSTTFEIRFDPLNAAAIRLVGQEIRTRHIAHYSALSTETLSNLRAIYASLQQESPGDPSSAKFLAVVQSLLGSRAPQSVGKPVVWPVRREP